MRYSIVFSPEAVEDLRRLKAANRSAVREAIEIHLRHQPLKESKSGIKRLRGIERPGYRLRVGQIRVFYDVRDDLVEILAIIPKSEVKAWLQKIEELQ
jgi:mRNA-degrading endonuclease RelE of RelBE toxin-antitoxin system